MSLTGFIVLFAVIWFITLWCLLPVGLRTQGDEGEVVEGTPQSAPANLNFGRKVLWTTIIATLVWLPIVLTIWYTDLDIMAIDPWKLIGTKEN